MVLASDPDTCLTSLLKQEYLKKSIFYLGSLILSSEN